MDYQEAIARFKRGYLVDSNGDTTQKDFEALKIAISAMNELQQYKYLGTLEEVREAVEKQKKKKPRASNRCYVCPRCGLVTSLKIKHNYCDACGQHIDWREEESTESYHPDKCHGCFGAENNDCERCVDEE